MRKKQPMKAMNPYINDAEKMPCAYCMLNKPANNNFSARMSDEIQRKKDNKDKISQKVIFGTSSKKTKVPKGSHRMPDGSIMKDKDMPKKKNNKKKSKKKNIY